MAVDDDPGIRETMPDIPLLCGYQTDAVDSGEQAVKRCRGGTLPDEVLLDVRMPGMSRIDTLRETKRISPAGRVIVITGFEVGELAIEAMDEGADALSRKPLDVASFLPIPPDAQRQGQVSRRESSNARI